MESHSALAKTLIVRRSKRSCTWASWPLDTHGRATKKRARLWCKKESKTQYTLSLKNLVVFVFWADATKADRRLKRRWRWRAGIGGHEIIGQRESDNFVQVICARLWLLATTFLLGNGSCVFHSGLIFHRGSRGDLYRGIWGPMLVTGPARELIRSMITFRIGTFDTISLLCCSATRLWLYCIVLGGCIGSIRLFSIRFVVILVNEVRLVFSRRLLLTLYVDSLNWNPNSGQNVFPDLELDWCVGLYEVRRGRGTCCIINVRKCKTDSTSDKNVFKCVTIWHF